MPEPPQEEVPPWYERAARQPRLRVLGWMAALLFHPFLYVFPVYRALDATYQNAREPCGGYSSYAGCFKRAFEDLRDETVYNCQVDRENPIPSTHARELVETLELASGLTLPLSKTNLSARDWIYNRHLPLFQQGFELKETNSYSAQKGSSIWRKISSHCDEQRLHFLRDEPVEPIAIYAEVRDLFQETARRFDKAIAEYERIRFLFGFLMWGWAVLQLAGVVLFLGIVRADLARWRRRASQRGRDE